MSNSVPLRGQADKSIGAGFAPLSVQAQNLPNLTVSIRAGSFWNSTSQVVEYPGGNSPSIPAPTLLNRWSLVSLTDTGSVVITHGATAAAPAIPAPPANTIPLAAIYMTPTTTAITPDRIMDVRPFVNTVNTVPNLAAELANRPTIADVDNDLALKADIDGTVSDSFTLNKDALVGTDTAIFVERGSLPNTGIRWNETLDRWEFTNDGSTWVAIASVSGSFMPIVSGATTGHVATLNSLGEVVDSGTALTALATDIELATKADKVVGAVVGNLAGLDAAGNLTDSGSAPSSFAPTVHTHPISAVTGLTSALAAKADLAGSTFTGNVVVDTTTAPALSVGEVSGTDVGLRVERGVDPDAIMYWDEASDSWVAGIVGDVGTIVTDANFGTKMDKVVGAVVGNVGTFVSTPEGGQMADSGTALSALATTSALTAGLAGKANTVHTHAAADVVSGTFADARISASSVTQHQSLLVVTASQVSDFGTAVDAAVAEPLNQIVYGTGTNIDSNANFTYNSGTATLTHVGTGATIVGGQEGSQFIIAAVDSTSPALTGTYLSLFGGDGIGTGAGGNTTVAAGQGGVSGTGGDMFISAGSGGGTAGDGGNISIVAGDGPNGGGGDVTIEAGTGGAGASGSITMNVELGTSFELDPDLNVQMGQSAPPTTATQGFPYIPVMSGPPTGTPTAKPGYVPIVVENNGVTYALWVYVDGAWRSTPLV